MKMLFSNKILFTNTGEFSIYRILHLEGWMSQRTIKHIWCGKNYDDQDV